MSLSEHPQDVCFRNSFLTNSIVMERNSHSVGVAAEQRGVRYLFNNNYNKQKTTLAFYIHINMDKTKLQQIQLRKYQ